MGSFFCFDPQDENSRPWQQIERPNLRLSPRGGNDVFRLHPNQQPPDFVQGLHHQQLSQQAAVSLDQLHSRRHHHHQHHHYHHQQRAGEASRQTREQLWPNNN